MIGLVAVMLFLGPGCKAEDKQPDVESEIRFSDIGVPEPIGDSLALAKKAHVNIIVLGKKKDDNTYWIKVAPPWVGICPGLNCDGVEFHWKLVGPGLEGDETLLIRDADPANHCFPNVPVTISPPNNAAESGLPLSHCVIAGGHTWEYVVELYKAGTTDPIASTDPGAIIHP